MAQLSTLGHEAMRDIPAIDPIEFEYMFSYVKERLATEPAPENILDWTRLISRLIGERYPRSEKRAHFLLRWVALKYLAGSGCLSPKYYHPPDDSGDDWLDSRAIHLAAVCPVLEKIRFDQKTFLSSLEEAA